MKPVSKKCPFLQVHHLNFFWATYFLARMFPILSKVQNVENWLTNAKLRTIPTSMSTLNYWLHNWYLIIRQNKQSPKAISKSNYIFFSKNHFLQTCEQCEILSEIDSVYKNICSMWLLIMQRIRCQVLKYIIIE